MLSAGCFRSGGHRATEIRKGLPAHRLTLSRGRAQRLPRGPVSAAPSSDPAGSHSRPPNGFKGGLPRREAPATLQTPPTGRNALVYENLAPAGSVRAGIWNRPSTVAYQFHADGGEDLEPVGVRRKRTAVPSCKGVCDGIRGPVTGIGMSWVPRRRYFPNGRNGGESSTPYMTGGARPRDRPTRPQDRREGRLRRSTACDADAARASGARSSGGP